MLILFCPLLPPGPWGNPFVLNVHMSSDVSQKSSLASDSFRLPCSPHPGLIHWHICLHVLPDLVEVLLSCMLVQTSSELLSGSMGLWVGSVLFSILERLIPELMSSWSSTGSAGVLAGSDLPQHPGATGTCTDTFLVLCRVCT